jgi:hypothetical protein
VANKPVEAVIFQIHDGSGFYKVPLTQQLVVTFAPVWDT